MKYCADIKVVLKQNIKDPQGITLAKVLKRIGADNSISIRVGKFFSIEFEAEGKNSALEKLNKICTDILTNPCLEEYEILKVKEL